MADLALALRLSGLVLRALVRRARAGLAAAKPLRWRFGGREPKKILFAPQDLRIADPTRAAEIVAGRFVFAGQSVETRASPFAVVAPSAAWTDMLVGFVWLRHLRAADGRDAEIAALGRRLVIEFLRGPQRRSAESLRPLATARRVLAWLGASPWLLDGAERGFSRGFLRSLAWQAHYLLAAGWGEDGLPRLTAAIAAVQAGLCLAGQDRLRRRATPWLARELVHQVLPDGGHVGRNPQAVIELLLDLLPLRQSFAARTLEPPPELLGAIDRLMPMMRFFRHADGAFAAFNGMGYTQHHLVAVLLAYDDVRGQPVHNASHSGYQRLEAGPSVLLVDSGRPPPASVSAEAHAGCGAFELSSGGSRLIVSCGAPAPGQERLRQLARTTAAHSTAVVGDASSALILRPVGWRRLLGRLIVDGPRRAAVERGEDDDGPYVVLEHDGYAKASGLAHRRALSLTPGGGLFGEDRFIGPRGAPYRGAMPVLIRFHCHPLVEVAAAADGLSAVLVPQGGGAWIFQAGGLPVELDESIHFANPEGPRRTTQLVLRLPPIQADDERADVVWSLVPSNLLSDLPETPP